MLSALSRLCVGLEDVQDRALPPRHRLWLGSYAVASLAYRVFLIGTIIWFIYQVLKPYGLTALAEMLAVVLVAGLLAAPVAQASRLMGNPVRRRQVHRGRLLLVTAAVALLGVAAAFVPLPRRIGASVVIQPEDAERVYVSVPGRLESTIAPGETVLDGDVIARLTNLELAAELEQAAGERDRQAVLVKNLDNRRADDPAAAAQLPGARSDLEKMEERLRELQEQRSKLRITAPVAGRVFPPDERPLRTESESGELPEWSGTPLDENNRGCWLSEGTVMCLVGDRRRREALLFIDEAEIEFVREGQPVRLSIDQASGEILEGTVTEVAYSDVKLAPRELAGGDDRPTRADEHGRPRFIETVYQARVRLDRHPPVRIGARGRAKIHAGSEPLWRKCDRFLRRTFHFEL
ncbi:MAG: HlyD family efflux transporter periplasmic adaptor subunit [Planctomycetaceae bacterium]